MNNVAIEVKGNKLVITIDGSADLGPSKSGKSRIVATTGGNQELAVGGRVLFLGINAYTK